MVKKLVELTSNENTEIKLSSIFALKNSLFIVPKQVKDIILKDFNLKRILELLNDDVTKV